MKTQMNISNLKKMVLTAFAVMVIAAGSYINANPATPEVSLAGLEAIMNSTEQSIRYNAPAATDSYEVSAEIERLEVLAAATEAIVKYDAPEVDAVAPELERLEVLAAATEASLKYAAPIAEEAAEVAPEMERLEMLAASTEASLEYHAPENNENSGNENFTENAAEILLANQTK
jgi:hypothetical protein